MTKDKKQSDNLQVIGPSAYISVAGHDDVPAKIDTGAEASAIWASGISINEDGALTFCLFGESSPFYDGKVIKTKDYKVIVTRSAMGQEQVRYRVFIPITINRHTIRVLFSLADRSRNNFPVLIGKRTLKGKFVVDVSLPNIKYSPKPKRRGRLDLKLLKEDPQKFHKLYVKKGEK